MKLSYISSYKFARLADFTFSEVVTKEQFKELNVTDYKILYENASHICYQKKEINIKNNYVIFCTNDSLDLLFRHVRKLNLTGLTLITNQTDEKISKYKFDKLPNQFSKWLSVNVDFKHKNLIPIPLGISNGYGKNLLFDKDEILVDQEKYKQNKENLLYLNFEKNTNIRIRNNLNNYFKNYEWSKVITEKKDIEEYERDLLTSNFVLCPEGNGIDTHRVWEALYSGSIPIVRNRDAFKNFNSLPILRVNSFYDITDQILKKYLNDLNVYDCKQLDFNYWVEYLKNEIDNSEEITKIQLNDNLNVLFQLKRSYYKKYLKIKNGIVRIIYKIKNKF